MMMMMVTVIMRSGLSELFLLLLTSCESGLGSVVSKEYAYFGSPNKWQDARSICRSQGYSDLATIHTEDDLDEVLIDRFYAWIGLSRSSDHSNWRWAVGPHTWENQFDNWAHDEPHHRDDCAVVSSRNKRFHGTRCYYHMFFICQTVVNGNYDYKFVPETKTWHEARQYCRDTFDDLAVTRDEAALNASVHQRNFPVWTGLRRDGQMWTWNLGSSTYSKWASDEPGNVGDCVAVSSLTEELTTYDCRRSYLPFLCMKENVVVVKESKTWEEALEHCRALGYELVSVQPGEDHRNVRGYILAADTEKVWTGLRFLAGRWFWSNAVPVSDGDLPLCPNEIRRCGALAKTGTGSVETIDCAERLNFLCYSTP